MIQYVLKCKDGHSFESWFQSASAFEALQTAGHLSCAVCGSASVTKAIMAPRVSTKGAAPVDTAPAETTSGQGVRTENALSKPQSDAEQALTQMRRHIEKNADYVGGNFAKEARDMYLGATPERAIYGEANGAEAKALIEDGVPVAPLPFVPNRKVN